MQELRDTSCIRDNNNLVIRM